MALLKKKNDNDIKKEKYLAAVGNILEAILYFFLCFFITIHLFMWSINKSKKIPRKASSMFIGGNF